MSIPPRRAVLSLPTTVRYRSFTQAESKESRPKRVGESSNQNWIGFYKEGMREKPPNESWVTERRIIPHLDL